jgi:hypothetical protein
VACDFLCRCAILIGTMVAIVVVDGRKPRYYAVITSSSGPDPATDLGRGTLDPAEFNLTHSRRLTDAPLTHVCIEVRSLLDVSYHGVPACMSTARSSSTDRGAPRQDGPDLRRLALAGAEVLTIPSFTSHDDGDSRLLAAGAAPRQAGRMTACCGIPAT